MAHRVQHSHFLAPYARRFHRVVLTHALALSRYCIRFFTQEEIPTRPSMNSGGFEPRIVDVSEDKINLLLNMGRLLCYLYKPVVRLTGYT